MRFTTARAAVALSAAGLLLVGCTATGGEQSSAEGVFHVGINQLVTHASLDSAVEGFRAAFEEAGLVEGTDVVFDIQNAQGEQSTAVSIASKFVEDGSDLILSVGTPSAQATLQSTQTVPLLFTAVTDPLAAGLVESLEAPGGNMTGVSSLNPVEDQLRLITEIAPDVQTVGVIYSSGEVNSTVQLEIAREVAPGLGLELKEVTISNSSEVAQGTESLGDIDAIYVPADNTVVSALDAVLQIAESKSIPVITADSASVTAGGVATYGVDYFALGKQTGEMALRILQDGEAPHEIAVESLREAALIVNPAAASRMGVEIPADLMDQASEVVQ